MSRPEFVGKGLMMGAAVIAGAVLAAVVPPVERAADGLKLAPPPREAPAAALPSFADLVERAIPSVVKVTSRKAVTEPEGGSLFDNPLFRRFFRHQNPHAPGGSQPQVQQAGSGFFFTTDGYILTNKHVIENGDTFRIQTNDGDLLDAELVGTDPYLDFAVLKVDADREFPALPLGDSESLRVGEWVVAIGHPLIFNYSVTVGVVSGKGRRIADNPGELGEYIQTDAAINFGNSGGPLLNSRGEVVGINTAIIRNGRVAFGEEQLVEGISFALPITPVRHVLEQIVRTGTVKRGFLGVTVSPVDRLVARYYGLEKPRGAVVEAVTEGMPAAEAGLRPGDIVLEVEGQPIADSSSLVRVISDHAPGDKVELVIWRDNSEHRLVVELAERPVSPSEASAAPEESREEAEPESESGLGFTVEAPSAEDREELADRGLEGVWITDVEPNSSAADRGIRPGLLLMELNGRPIRSVEDYRRAVEEIASGSVVRARVADPGRSEALVFFEAP